MGKENYRELKESASKNGMALFGVADVSPLKKDFKIYPEDLLNDLNYGISYGYILSSKVLEGIVDKPTKLYSAHYTRVNYLLDMAGLILSNEIERKGCKALPIPASIVVDWEDPKGHLSHVRVAEKAGLGWIGRSNLLVNPQFGARVRYATVLTNMPLPVDVEFKGDCGSCAACIKGCPAKAIGGSSEDFNKEACADKLKTFAKIPGIKSMICGLCVRVCSPETEGFPDVKTQTI